MRVLGPFVILQRLVPTRMSFRLYRDPGHCVARNVGHLWAQKGQVLCLEKSSVIMTNYDDWLMSLTATKDIVSAQPDRTKSAKCLGKLDLGEMEDVGHGGWKRSWLIPPLVRPLDFKRVTSL